MIGINNTWRRYDRNDPTPVETFEDELRKILKKTREETDAGIMLIEPFVLPEPEDRKTWREDLDPKIQVTRALAIEFKAALLPLDGIFAQYCAIKPAVFWSPDGVHPTREGHMLIALKWCEAVFGM
jgi:lysophospholipase L1-like esterase